MFVLAQRLTFRAMIVIDYAISTGTIVQDIGINGILCD